STQHRLHRLVSIPATPDLPRIASLFFQGYGDHRALHSFPTRRSSDLENILHRNFTRRQVAIQNRVASNIGISQSTFSVKVLNLFSRSRRKTNKRKSKHSAMLRNKEIQYLNAKGALDRKSGSAGMPRPISYAVFCLKKNKTRDNYDA